MDRTAIHQLAIVLNDLRHRAPEILAGVPDHYKWPVLNSLALAADAARHAAQVAEEAALATQAPEACLVRVYGACSEPRSA
jgi:hypothetical protein